MNKIQAKKLLASAGRTAGVVVQVRAGKDNADEIRVLNASRKKVLASGTIALDASKKGYQDKDVREILSQVRSLKSSRKRVNCSEEYDDPNPDDFEGDDAGFVDDVESIVTDDQGNEVQVDDMLVVQDPETSEIALFIPTDEDEQLPENLEVIGEVLPSDDAAVLDSSRRVKSRGRKMNASKRKSSQRRTKLNSSRASLIDQLNEVYESDAYEDVESALAQAAGFSESEMEHLSDADEDEGFYANFTTQQLEKALDILNGNVSESDAKLPLTVAEIQVLKRAMEDYSQPSFTKDREMSRVATQILKKLNSLF